MYQGEKLNSISHLVGTVFSLMALGSLLTVSLQTADPFIIFSFTTFGFSMVLLYSMSTLYHSIPPSNLKRIFKLFDHIAIYLLIAGTYTPYMLITLGTSTGLQILSLVWLLAIIGILSEVFITGRLIKVCQMLIYLAMGWACSLDIGTLKTMLPEMGFFWLVTGGVAYTVGVIFYIADELGVLKHAHGIWHFFVLTGTASHFISIIGFVR
jgi:hemolysin III